MGLTFKMPRFTKVNKNKNNGLQKTSVYLELPEAGGKTLKAATELCIFAGTFRQPNGHI